LSTHKIYALDVAFYYYSGEIIMCEYCEKPLVDPSSIGRIKFEPISMDNSTAVDVFRRFMNPTAYKAAMAMAQPSGVAQPTMKLVADLTAAIKLPTSTPQDFKTARAAVDQVKAEVDQAEKARTAKILAGLKGVLALEKMDTNVPKRFLISVFKDGDYSTHAGLHDRREGTVLVDLPHLDDECFGSWHEFSSNMRAAGIVYEWEYID
jgi:hypothetical protein